MTSSLSAAAEGRRQVRRFDFWLLVAALLLVVAGLLALYSEGMPKDHGANFRRQVLNTGIGLVPFAIMYWVDPKFWRRVVPALYAAMIGLLMLTLVLGKDAKGAQRWINVGPLQFQPSELAKLLAILTLAAYFANRSGEIEKLSTFLFGLLHIAVPVGLILLQPHLGAALVMMVMWFAISWAAGTPAKYYGLLVLVLIVAIPVALKIPAVSNKLLHGYQKDRIKGLMSKKKDTQGSNWQTDRAAIAFGVGGVSGTGFLKGEQKRGRFIPEQRNDFVFTVVGEEGGLVGCSILLMTYAFFFYRIFVVMQAASDPYFRMIASGIFAVLGFHTFVNMAMVLQILPVVGLWLPFMSSGGTAIWLCMACVGLLLNMRRREPVILF
jgi:rod shape determining protein RodA